MANQPPVHAGHSLCGWRAAGALGGAAAGVGVVMHTEDEARERWCPETRVVGVYYADNRDTMASGNRFGHPHMNEPFELRQGTRCIASECMHWRWEPATLGSLDVKGDTITIKRERGYCGKSGKP